MIYSTTSVPFNSNGRNHEKPVTVVLLKGSPLSINFIRKHTYRRERRTEKKANRDEAELSDETKLDFLTLGRVTAREIDAYVTNIRD